MTLLGDARGVHDGPVGPLPPPWGVTVICASGFGESAEESGLGVSVAGLRYVSTRIV